jgi:hypothetical protein
MTARTAVASGRDTAAATRFAASPPRMFRAASTR